MHGAAAITDLDGVTTYQVGRYVVTRFDRPSYLVRFMDDNGATFSRVCMAIDADGETVALFGYLNRADRLTVDDWQDAAGALFPSARRVLFERRNPKTGVTTFHELILPPTPERNIS